MMKVWVEAAEGNRGGKVDDGSVNNERGGE